MRTANSFASRTASLTSISDTAFSLANTGTPLFRAPSILHRQHDLSKMLPGRHVLEGGGGLLQGENPVDDRLEAVQGDRPVHRLEALAVPHQDALDADLPHE